MTPREIHEAYRRALETVRDEAASPEAREAAQKDVIDLRHQLDEAMVTEQEDRENDRISEAIEARERAAKEVAQLGVVAPPKSMLPVDEIRAYANSKKRGETLSFTILPESRADWTRIDTTTYAGVYTVPQSWMDEVYMYQIAQSGVLRAGPRILTTATGNQINYPKLVTDMSSAAGLEGAAATESNPVLGTTPLNQARIDGFTPISDELIRDSGVDIEGLVRELAGRSLAAKAAPYYGDEDVGTGSGLIPAAITIGTTLGVTAVSTTAPTLDEVKSLKFSVLPAYRPRASWIGNSTLTLAVALMKDDNGNYMWQPSASAAEPDKLFGNPWHEDAYFDASASAGKVLTYGDVGAAYIVRRIGGLQVDFSRDYAFTSFETTVRWAMWHDAATIDTLAVKHLVLA